MKKITTLFMLTISIVALSQKLKTFSGAFADGKSQNGNAVYTYYEDPETHEYVKQGSFKYTFVGKSDYKGYNQTISGSFDKGLKNGLWSYTITMIDFGNRGDYSTGTVTLVANYKNGYANGNWKEVRSIKTRRWNYYNWTPFGPLKTMNISMNFKDGSIVGNVNINDGFAKFKATGNYDNNSLCIGTWLIDDLGWGKHRELIYKENILYEFIARDNNGKVLDGTTKYQTDYDNLVKFKLLTPKETDEAGISLDTVCGGDLCAATNNIKEYFKQFLQNEVFLYDYIGGDLTYKEGFNGGCNLQITTNNYTDLSNNQFFKDAEDYYNKNDLLKAYELYKKIEIGKVKPSQQINVTDKIALLEPMIGDLIKMYISNSNFFQDYSIAEYDSLEKDKSYFASKIALKATKGDYGWATISVENGMPRKLYDNSGWIKYNFEKPWENKDWELTKSCFESNKGVYSKTQIAVTEKYFLYLSLFEKEGIKIKKTEYNYHFDNTRFHFYTYDKNTFLNNLEEAKKEYNLAKALIDLQSKSDEKKIQIENLNNQNKKKTLFSKHQIVITDFNTSFQSNTEIQPLFDNLSNLNLFLDKVILLYSKDTKELEKQLKEVETIDQIKSIILGE